MPAERGWRGKEVHSLFFCCCQVSLYRSGYCPTSAVNQLINVTKRPNQPTQYTKFDSTSIYDDGHDVFLLEAKERERERVGS